MVFIIRTEDISCDLETEYANIIQRKNPCSKLSNFLNLNLGAVIIVLRTLTQN
jgi:hypothetical protein